MSLRNTVVLITFSRVSPAAARTAWTFSRDWRVWPATPPSAKAPVAGSTGSWPEVMTMPPADTPWE